MNITDRIAAELNIQTRTVNTVTALFNEGNTIPFIARYRKEATGNLDEVAIFNIHKRLGYYNDLESRKQTILKSIDEQGKLTEPLKQSILNCLDKQLLEDLYLPYKQKKKTKASIAVEKGLAPLAEIIYKQKEFEGSRQELLSRYINPDKGVETEDDALSGALDIIAQNISENSKFRSWLRKEVMQKGELAVAVKKAWAGKKTKYEMYYKYSEVLHRSAAHRILAVRRGTEEKVLGWKIKVNSTGIITYLERQIIHNNNHSFCRDLLLATEDSYKRLLFPSIENECFNNKVENAFEESIKVFSKNLKNLLLASPAGNKKILGIDPGIRTGCKIAGINGNGSFLANAVIYPGQSEIKAKEAESILLDFIKKYNIELIAIGNGTASKETMSFVKNVIKDNYPDVVPVIVSESGASVYSASEIARKEFPKLDLTVRGAISIARRLQDPLSELVKVDPKSIGVGQYQHDVNQKHLGTELDFVVEYCVNHVGVDLNTASVSLLSHVAGIGPVLAENIERYRNENKGFSDRKALRKVAKMGSKAFEQCAGFLRIRNGANPLDNSAIHPERYALVNAIAKDCGVEPGLLIGNKQKIETIDLSAYVSDEVGLPTLKDIKEELLKPGLDPRAEFVYAKLSSEINSIEDLEKGMVVEGAVTNVTNFGAFVDIGVHQDGLVHISQLSDQYISNVHDVVAVGDRLSVEVLDIDVELKRIALKNVT